MHSSLTSELADSRVRDLHASAARERLVAIARGRRRTPPMAAGPAPADTIRWASGERDATALARLAALDSTRAPRGDVLVAEVGGQLWAAFAPETQEQIADPFHPTADLLRLLIVRGRQVGRADRERSAAQSLPGPAAAVGMC